MVYYKNVHYVISLIQVSRLHVIRGKRIQYKKQKNSEKCTRPKYREWYTKALIFKILQTKGPIIFVNNTLTYKQARTRLTCTACTYNVFYMLILCRG